MKNEVDISEDLILYRSWMLYIIAFALLGVLGVFSFDHYSDFFYYTIGMIWIAVGYILVSYLIHILLGFILYDTDFHIRCLLDSVVYSILIFVTTMIFSGELWLSITLALIYAVAVEFPRFGLITYYDKGNPEIALIRFLVDYYITFLLALFSLFLILLLLKIPEIESGDIGLVLITNTVISLFLLFLSFKLKSKIQFKRIFGIVKFEAMLILIYFIVLITIELIEVVRNSSS